MSPSSKRIKIFDTTLRDGEQSPRVSWNIEEKLRIARALERLGVDVIEAGFPIASPDDFSAVQRISREVREPVICALARAASEDIKRAGEAVRDAERPRIHTFVSTSDIHIQHQLQSDRDDVRGLARASVALARELCDDVEFSPMDATRAELEFTTEICAIAIAEGASVINIPDTVGYATPEEYGRMISTLRRSLGIVEGGGVELSVHCHDDLGLAVANSWSGIRSGARQVESAINGIGERAGNCSTEEIIMLLKTRGGAYETGADSTQIASASRLVSRLSGYPIQPNKAIVGRNAFAHESGIHQDGVLKDPTTYEIIDPADVGLVSNELVLGKHSGRHALSEALSDLGRPLAGADLNSVFKEFKLLTAKKKEITSDDLLALVEQRSTAGVEPPLKWEWFECESGSARAPKARVLLKNADGRDSYGGGTGDGPVEAVFEAILNGAVEAGALDSTDRHQISFSELRVSSVTEGGDALGEASVVVTAFGRSETGRAVSPDVVEAAALAYLMALNRILMRSSEESS